MTFVPVGYALERIPSPDQSCFIEMSADKLERDGPAALGEARGQCDCRTSSHIEGAGEAKKTGDQFGVLGQSRHFGECRRGKGLGGNGRRSIVPISARTWPRNASRRKTIFW